MDHLGTEVREHQPIQKRFLETPPFYHSRMLANRYGCDLAVPTGQGVGNVVVFTRLVEDYARSIGRRLQLLTGPLQPFVGTVAEEEPFPVWNHNPFIAGIVNLEEREPGAIDRINQEQDNVVTYSHVISNILFHYGLKPFVLKPSLFLSAEERVWAIDRLQAFSRPIVCVHAGGTSSPLPPSPWFDENWRRIATRMSGEASLVLIGQAGFDDKDLGMPFIPTTLREAMALIWAADAFVGFDSGPAHIATAFDVPSIVLWEVLRKVPIEERHEPGFGASALTKWAYPQNTNFMLLGERDHEIVDLVLDRLEAILQSKNHKRDSGRQA